MTVGMTLGVSGGPRIDELSRRIAEVGDVPGVVPDLRRVPREEQPVPLRAQLARAVAGEHVGALPGRERQRRAVRERGKAIHVHVLLRGRVVGQLEAGQRQRARAVVRDLNVLAAAVAAAQVDVADVQSGQGRVLLRSMARPLDERAVEPVGVSRGRLGIIVGIGPGAWDRLPACSSWRLATSETDHRRKGEPNERAEQEADSDRNQPGQDDGRELATDAVAHRAGSRAASWMLGAGIARRVSGLADLVVNVPEEGEEAARDGAETEHRVAQVASERALPSGVERHQLRYRQDAREPKPPREMCAANGAGEGGSPFWLVPIASNSDN